MSTTSVYVYAVIFAAVFILIALVVAKMIDFEGGQNPRDPFKRKLWFWVLGVAASISNFLFGYFTIYLPESNPYYQSQLITAIGIATGVSLVLYILLGFVLSKVIKDGKINNWFS